jgi:hypothetical protein
MSRFGCARARTQVIEKKCRQVHCWAMGTLVDDAPTGTRTQISYNPYRAGTFTQRSDGASVNACEFVISPDKKVPSPSAMLSEGAADDCSQYDRITNSCRVRPERNCGSRTGRQQCPNRCFTNS